MNKFKELLTRLSIPQKDFAKEIGITYGSFRTMTAKKRLEDKVPSWMKAFSLGVKLGSRHGAEIDVTKYEN